MLLVNDYLSEDVEQTIRDLVLLTLPDDPKNPELNDERSELDRELLGEARDLLRHELADRAPARQDCGRRRGCRSQRPSGRGTARGQQLGARLPPFTNRSERLSP